MPSQKEMEELISKCKWTLSKQNNVEGFKITGPSGGSIFLPFAGWRKENIKEEIGTFGAYWTSSISKYFSESAGATYFYWRMKDTGSSGERYKGFPVRPVAE